MSDLVNTQVIDKTNKYGTPMNTTHPTNLRVSSIKILYNEYDL